MPVDAYAAGARRDDKSGSGPIDNLVCTTYK
jgi:hypothetical protein